VVLAHAYDDWTTGMTYEERQRFDGWLSAPFVAAEVAAPVIYAPPADVMEEMKRTWGRTPEAQQGLRLVMGG